MEQKEDIMFKNHANIQHVVVILVIILLTAFFTSNIFAYIIGSPGLFLMYYITYKIHKKYSGFKREVLVYVFVIAALFYTFVWAVFVASLM